MRADLNDAVGSLGHLQRVAGVLHGFGEGFLAIDITASLDSFGEVQRVLEVRRGDDHGIGFAFLIKFLVVAIGLDIDAGVLLRPCNSLIAAHAPQIGNRAELDIVIFCQSGHGRPQAALEAIGESHDGHADAVVGAWGAGVDPGGGTEPGGDGKSADGSSAEKIATADVGWFGWVHLGF